MKIMIKEFNVEGEEVVRNGQLNLVDLAGWETITVCTFLQSDVSFLYLNLARSA